MKKSGSNNQMALKQFQIWESKLKIYTIEWQFEQQQNLEVRNLNESEKSEIIRI